MLSNVNYSIFKARGNGVLQTAFKAFKGDGSEYQWYPAQSTAPYWISITCPTPVRIWKVGLRGRNKDTDRLYDRRIEASQTDRYSVHDWDTI